MESPSEMTAAAAGALRQPFPDEMIGQLPRAGTTLDYVGHAAVTDRLLSVDPGWTWEPFAADADGGPLITYSGNDAFLWIRLTVCGVTRIGVGSESAKTNDLCKKLVSDALRNAAMRFGVALDLWSKEDLTPEPSEPTIDDLARAAGWADEFHRKNAHDSLAARIKAAGKVEQAKAFRDEHGWPLSLSRWKQLDTLVTSDEPVGPYGPGVSGTPLLGAADSEQGGESSAPARSPKGEA